MCSYWNYTQRDCVSSVYKAYRNSEITCNCYPACSTEAYGGMASSSEWPSPQFTPYLVQILRKNSDSEIIQEYLEALLSDAGNDAIISDMELLSEELRKQFLRVEIFFQELNFQELKESPKYTITNLMSDFGGNIGLWIGWSVLTFLEILVLIFNLGKIVATGRMC